MIECTENNIYYKCCKKKKFKIKRLISWIIIIAIIISVIMYYKYFVINEVIEITGEYVNTYCTESINQAVIKEIKSKEYNDFINIEKNDKGEIILISANTYTTNILSKQIVSSTKEILKDKLKNGVPVPLLAFTGINLISGYGRTVNFKSIVIDDVSSDFLSEFKSVGINQTLHSIYIEVISKVTIVLPLEKINKQSKTKVLLCESVLVGKVPEIYLKV